MGDGVALAVTDMADDGGGLAFGVVLAVPPHPARERASAAPASARKSERDDMEYPHYPSEMMA